MAHPQIGETRICAVTGKSFVIAQEGCTFNYATRNGGHEVVSDEGVNLSEVEALKDRSQPYAAYISSDGKHLTGWKGNVLGRVISAKPVKLAKWSHWHGSTMTAYRIRDVHGAMWFGRGSAGLCITLRALKGA